MSKLKELDKLNKRLDELDVELQTAKDRIGCAILFLVFNTIALVLSILGFFRQEIPEILSFIY